MKAYLHDLASPSWLPSLELGRKEAKTPAPDKVNDRYKRASQRKHKRDVSDAVSLLLFLKKRRIEFSSTSSSSSDVTVNDVHVEDIPETGDSENEDHIPDIIQPSDENCQSVQTDLTFEGLEQIEKDNQSRMLEANERAAVENRIYHFQTYVEDPDIVSFYTGLPNLGVLKLVFDMAESQMSSSSKTLTKEEEFFICLINCE